jgi:hypothetical protein
LEGHKKVSNILHAHVPATAVQDTNNFCIKELILGKRQITVRDIASISGISVGNVETIIHELSLFETLGALWVPKVLMSDQMAENVAVSAGRLHRFEMEENVLLELIVI